MTKTILSVVGSEANAPRDLLMEIMREGAGALIVQFPSRNRFGEFDDTVFS